jgi:hypothetical protein
MDLTFIGSGRPAAWCARPLRASVGLCGYLPVDLAPLDAEKRAYILPDNRLAEPTGWDREILAMELLGPRQPTEL